MKRIAFVLALVSSPAFAQPAIMGVTGTVTNGAPVTITGTRLGTHGDFGGTQPFLNVAWNDFSTAINGGNLALDGTNNAAWSYETTGGRTRTSAWAKHNWNPSANESIRRLGALSLTMSGTTGTYYASFYLRCGRNLIPQGKFFRLYGTGQDLYLSINQTNLMAFAEGHGTPAPTTVWGAVTDPMTCASSWPRIEVFVRDSPDDYVDVFIDGVRAFRRGSALPSVHREIEGSQGNERQQWVVRPWGGNGHTLDFASMVDGDFYGISDAYADYTQARVELSASATWAAARHKEIQIPMEWADGRIVVKANVGTLTGAAYLYVVDAAGVVNAKGYPVTIRPQ